jgi:drug/metabolite transporter (DMT)-like permease
LRPRPDWLPAFLLLGITATWGWTFVVVKNALAVYAPLPFLAVRFTLAAGLLGLVLVGFRRRPLGRIGYGIGAVLAVAYLLQTVGLKSTSPANAGLLTGLFVVFVPLIEWLFFRTRLWPGTLVAAGTALLGTVLLTRGAAPAAARIGDLLVVAGALAFAWHIVLLSRFAATRWALGLAGQQMLAAAVLFGAGTLTTGQSLTPIPRAAWFALGVTALVASAAGFWVQTYAQQRLTADRAALLIAAEPVFAVLFAVWLAGQRFGWLQAAGAAVILTTIGLHEARFPRSVAGNGTAGAG